MLDARKTTTFWDDGIEWRRMTAFNDDNTGPFSYTVHCTLGLRSPRWNMTTKCRSSSVILSTMCTAEMRRHYGFLHQTVSCILSALVIYKATCYWRHVSNSVSSTTPVDLPKCATRTAHPLYHCLSVTTFPTHTCVFWWQSRMLKSLAIRQNLRTREMRRWDIWELSWTSEGLYSTSARFGVCSEARRYSISYSQDICTTEFFKAKNAGKLFDEYSM